MIITLTCCLHDNLGDQDFNFIYTLLHKKLLKYKH
jgi:hypothetical protein